MRELEGHTSKVLALAALPRAGLIASGSFDNSVLLWDPATALCVAEIRGVHTVSLCAEKQQYERAVRRDSWTQ